MKRYSDDQLREMALTGDREKLARLLIGLYEMATEADEIIELQAKKIEELKEERRQTWELIEQVDRGEQ